MKQLNFLDNQKAPHLDEHWVLFSDGASRNNPGPAGAGVYILKDEEDFYQDGFYLGSKTNNQAEYLALLLGLFIVCKIKNPNATLRIVSDSELLVKQLKGEYRVKNPELKQLHHIAQEMLRSCNAQIMHVLRTDNTIADRMANRGIDEKKQLPQDFITMLARHEISL